MAPLHRFSRTELLVGKELERRTAMWPFGLRWGATLPGALPLRNGTTPLLISTTHQPQPKPRATTITVGGQVGGDGGADAGSADARSGRSRRSTMRAAGTAVDNGYDYVLDAIDHHRRCTCWPPAGAGIPVIASMGRQAAEPADQVGDISKAIPAMYGMYGNCCERVT